MEDKAINDYFLSLYNDALLFSKDVDSLIKEIDVLDDEKFILSIIHKINEINEQCNYPKSAIDNLDKIITFLEKNVYENEYVTLARRKYNELLKKDMNEEIYRYEAMIKFLDLDYSLIDDIELNKEVIETSITFDLISFYSLICEKYDITENYYYIASLKKFFKEFPELFLVESINENAKKILEKNSKYEESKRLMYKLEHIDKFTDNNFDYIRFKAMVDFIYVQNMLFNMEWYNLNKSAVGEDKIISLYNIIKYDLLFEEKMKNNALDIMHDYKNNKIDNLNIESKKMKLIEYNDIIGKLNTIKYDIAPFIMGEYENRLEGFDKIKALIKPLDLKKLIRNDLLILIELTNDEKPRKEYKKAYLSFNKFLNVIPDMFDNEIIYNKSMQLLKEKNIGTLKVKRKIKKQFTR